MFWQKSYEKSKALTKIEQNTDSLIYYPILYYVVADDICNYQSSAATKLVTHMVCMQKLAVRTRLTQKIFSTDYLSDEGKWKSVIGWLFVTLSVSSVACVRGLSFVEVLYTERWVETLYSKPKSTVSLA